MFAPDRAGSTPAPAARRSLGLCLGALLLASCAAPPPIPIFPQGQGRAVDAAIQKDKWKVLQGNFRLHDGGLEATKGAVIFAERYEGVKYGVTVEHIGGKTSPYISVGWNGFIFRGGTERYLDGSADWENYSFEFNFDGKVTLWRGDKGRWRHIAWKGYKRHPSIKPGKNRIEIESKGGVHKISVNGAPIHVAKDDKHDLGSVSLWVEDGGGAFRFTDIEVTPL